MPKFYRLEVSLRLLELSSPQGPPLQQGIRHQYFLNRDFRFPIADDGATFVVLRAVADLEEEMSECLDVLSMELAHYAEESKDY